MIRKVSSDLWWRDAIVYCLDVQTFLDTDGDGQGDIGGVIERIDYLAGMGVTCLWLMPFYPSADRDDGYDILDFYAVDPRLGTLGDFTEMVRTAGDRGIRVIADLVVNHTSIHHPWFQSARSSRDSPFRDWYVWSDEKPRERPGDVVFPDQENSNWAWDDEAGQWYLHRFYTEQPDLNVANPRVRDEIAQIAGFWMQQGLAGFRVDAVPFLIEPVGMPPGAIEDPHELLADLRAYLGRRRGDAVLLGEVNLPPPDQARFFGDGRREIDMMFDFHAMQAMYLSLARQDAGPLAEALERRPKPPDGCAWAVFARNHDELTLDQLSDDERAEVFDAFCPSEDLQLYGRGLRMRLPTMLDGDQRRLRMAYSLIFSLPGAPVLFYGEEIGMGENRDIPGRLAVRSPMQWSGRCQRRFLVRSRGRALPAGHRHARLRRGGRQRGGPAARRGVAAQLVRAAHPEAAGIAGDRARQLHGPSHRRSGGARAPLRLGGSRDRRRSQPRRTQRAGRSDGACARRGRGPDRPVRHARPGRGVPTGRSSSTWSPTATGGSPCGRQGPAMPAPTTATTPRAPPRGSCTSGRGSSTSRVARPCRRRSSPPRSRAALVP